MSHLRGALTRAAASLTAIAVIAGVLVVPEAVDAAQVLAAADRDAAALDYQFARLSTADFDAEIELALAQSDYDLARSALTLADQRNIAVDAVLRRQAEAGAPFDLFAVPAAAASCLTTRTIETDTDLLCVATSDLSGIGDVTDIVTEGGKLVAGEPYDGVTLGIATLGIGLTAATIATAGALWPARMGASFVKAANKTRRIPDWLVRQFGNTVSNSINPRALDDTLALAGQGRLIDAAVPAGRILDGAAMGRMMDTAGDMGRVLQAGGVRSLNATFEIADDANDLRRAGRVAERTGSGFLATVRMLGAGALGIAGIVWTLGVWTVAGIGWLVAVIGALLWIVTGLYRLVFPRRRVRLA